MYSARSLYLDQAPLAISTTTATRDDEAEILGRFLQAAGWDVRQVSCYSDVTTNGSMGFGPSCLAGDEVFWTVSNSDTMVGIVVTNNPFGIDPESGCLKPSGLPPVLIADAGAPATHQGVMVAIGRLFPKLGNDDPDDGSIEVLSATKSRIRTGNPRNSQTLPISIGGQLNTSGIPFSNGGWACRCQPSRRTVLKNGVKTQYGAGNYISLFMSSLPKNNVSGNPQRFWVGCAKDLLPSPADNPETIVDTKQTNPTLMTTFAGIAGHMGSLDTHRVIAVANPHQLILNSENAITGAKLSHLVAGALKLVDARHLGFSQDLPITEATYFAVHDAANSFRNAAHLEGFWTRVSTNGTHRTSSTAGGGNTHSPQLFIYNVIGDRSSIPQGILWDGDLSEVGEPWFGWSNNLLGGAASTLVAPVLGQLWDAMSLTETTPDPNGVSLFPWDKENWKRYSKSPTPFAHTLCLRVTKIHTP